MKQTVKLVQTIAVMVLAHAVTGSAGTIFDNGDLVVTNNLTVTNNAYIIKGKVGIGTASPVANLDVDSTGQAYVRYFSANATLGSVLELRNDTASPTFYGAINFNTLSSVPGQLGYGPGGMTFSSGATERMRIRPTGNVGIGTGFPNELLEIGGNGRAFFGNGAGLFGANRQGLLIDGVNDGTYARIEAYNYATSSGLPLALNQAGGYVGIGTQPEQVLDVQAPICEGRFTSTANGNGAVIELRNTTSSPTLLGAINFNDAGDNFPGQIAFKANGDMTFRATTVVVPVLQITGGSDVAEPFKITTRDIPKGALVVIDEANPGHLKLSEHAYDTRVAGILSGANGIKPGLSLSQQGVNDGGENVALSGRVYALADASNGPIKPGDLLTTSDTPGHCMKVRDHTKAQGAIIGKAMSSLESGKGMVLVLVSLQ